MDNCSVLVAFFEEMRHPLFQIKDHLAEHAISPAEPGQGYQSVELRIARGRVRSKDVPLPRPVLRVPCIDTLVN